MPDTRQHRILDAAIEVLGGEGSRGLTHRAVDAAAGLPAGSTSNHFRSRQALIQGIVSRMESLDQQEWQAMSAALPPAGGNGPAVAEMSAAPPTGTDGLATAEMPASPPVGTAGLAVALGMFVSHALGPARVRTAARYMLFLEAATRPELREPLARSREAIRRWGTPWIERLGSPRPDEHTSLVLDYLDGLILHQLTFPQTDFDPVPGIRDLLSSLIKP